MLNIFSKAREQKAVNYSTTGIWFKKKVPNNDRDFLHD